MKRCAPCRRKLARGEPAGLVGRCVECNRIRTKLSYWKRLGRAKLEARITKLDAERKELREIRSWLD